MRLPVVSLGQKCWAIKLGQNTPVLLQQCLVFKKNRMEKWEFLGSNGNPDGAVIPGTLWEEDNQWGTVLPSYQPHRMRKQDMLVGEWCWIWRAMRSVMAEECSKEKRCAVETLITRCHSRIVLTIPCLGWGLIIMIWPRNVTWDEKWCSCKTNSR